MTRRRLAAILRGFFLSAGLLAVLACSAPDPDAPAEELYDYYCLRCHGSDGRGTPEQLEQNPKNDLSGSEMIAGGDRAAVRERIEQGYGPMPALAGKVEPRVIEKLTEHTLELFPSH